MCATLWDLLGSACYCHFFRRLSKNKHRALSTPGYLLSILQELLYDPRALTEMAEAMQVRKTINEPNRYVVRDQRKKGSENCHCVSNSKSRCFCLRRVEVHTYKDMTTHDCQVANTEQDNVNVRARRSNVSTGLERQGVLMWKLPVNSRQCRPVLKFVSFQAGFIPLAVPECVTCRWGRRWGETGEFFENQYGTSRASANVNRHSSTRKNWGITWILV